MFPVYEIIALRGKHYGINIAVNNLGKGKRLGFVQAKNIRAEQYKIIVTEQIKINIIFINRCKSLGEKGLVKLKFGKEFF